MSGVRLAGLTVLLAVVAACSSTSPAATPSAASATPAGGATASASASEPASPAASSSAAPSGGAGGSTLEDLSGTWRASVENARVVSATGAHAGGTVAIEGDRLVFTAGDYRSEHPFDLADTLTLDCNATRCKVGGMPLVQVQADGGDLVVVDAVTLTPLGDLDDRCGWTDVPDAGVVQIEKTGSVGGREVPTALRFAAGLGGGVGTDCADGSWVVAWDVVATRQG